MSVLRKRPGKEYWSRRSLSFTAEELTAISNGEVTKIIVMSPSMRTLCEIEYFDNILSSITGKEDYYIARYKKEDIVKKRRIP